MIESTDAGLMWWRISRFGCRVRSAILTMGGVAMLIGAAIALESTPQATGAHQDHRRASPPMVGRISDAVVEHQPEPGMSADQGVPPLRCTSDSVDGAVWILKP